jgi:hypothetical protein
MKILVPTEPEKGQSLLTMFYGKKNENIDLFLI